MSRTRILFCLLCLCLFAATGCKKTEEDTTSQKELDFTIVPEADLPDNLKTIIDERKTNEFQLTYLAEDALYIVQGFGQQKTGGYSIQVMECCLTSDSIRFGCELTGPSEQDRVSQRPSYPYIVIKTEPMELPVVFTSK